MALDRPQWLTDLSRAFKRHRQGRSGWAVEVMRDRLRVVSSEIPPRPGEPPDARPRRRSVTMATPPGPASAAVALAECCALFDAVLAGDWRWPDPDDLPREGESGHLSAATLQRSALKLKAAIVGERVTPATWTRMYAPFLDRLVAAAGERVWQEDQELLVAVLRQWPPNTRARQMAHDRFRRLWKEAGWTWPEAVACLRGNGKAAAAAEGVRAFSDDELVELRARIERSRLGHSDLVAWDLLIVFGLRPSELQGVELLEGDGMLLAKVVRVKRSSRGSSGPRTVPAVPPSGWPADCHDLLNRWQRCGLPIAMVAARSPGEVLSQQLSRLRRQEPVNIELSDELTSYGCRHAFALRLAQRVGLHVREAAELMGHSPAVHLSTYGRRLDQPALLAKVRRRMGDGAGPP